MDQIVQGDLPRNCSFNPDDWRILAKSWFPVCAVAELEAGPVGAVLLDQPLVIYRSGDEIVAANDLCPHRGVPLSMGTQDGEAGIRCAYHGLRFGAGGLCDHVPANPDMAIPSRLHLRTYDAAERYGLVWVRLRPGEEGPLSDIPGMPHWDDPAFQQILCPAFDIAGFAGRQMEGFLDVAHFAWVHTSTFADPGNAVVPSYVPVKTETGFSAEYRSTVPNYPVGVENTAPEGFVWLRHFLVHLPFTATLTVHFPDDGRLVIMNAASPVSARATRLFVPIARNFDKHIPVEAVHEFNRRVFEEDRRMVEAQKPEFLPLDVALEAHIMADRSSFAYRKGLLGMGFSRIFAA